MNNENTVYLAGKITGDPEYKQKFEAACRELERAGYIVLNPAMLPETGFEYAAYIRISKAMMDECAQVDTGVVLHSPRVDFIARQQVKSGVEIEIELTPERAAPYTIEQLEEIRTGAGALCAVVMVSDLEHPENEDVSAILDWDFKQSELVAVWGYGVEPYRARDYMTKWAAFPHIKQDAK